MRVAGMVAGIFFTALSAAAVAATAPTAGTAATLAAAQGSASAIARGKILTETCAFCHGTEDYTVAYPTEHVPFIGGQSAAYIVSALGEYAKGDRHFPTMHAQAASLTTDQIAAIAAYIGTLARSLPPTAAGSGSKPPAIAATCAACHGARGVSTNPEFPSLAGQYADYLLLALKEYKSGKRKNAIMNGEAAPLTLEQMKELAAYFGKQAGPLRLLPKAGLQ